MTSRSLLLQQLDNDFSDENRRRCAEAAGPLTQAVDELTTFASSPEFASIPARISPQVSGLLLSLPLEAPAFSTAIIECL